MSSKSCVIKKGFSTFLMLTGFLWSAFFPAFARTWVGCGRLWSSPHCFHSEGFSPVRFPSCFWRSLGNKRFTTCLPFIGLLSGVIYFVLWRFLRQLKALLHVSHRRLSFLCESLHVFEKFDGSCRLFHTVYADGVSPRCSLRWNWRTKLFVTFLIWIYESVFSPLWFLSCVSKQGRQPKAPCAHCVHGAPLCNAQPGACRRVMGWTVQENVSTHTVFPRLHSKRSFLVQFEAWNKVGIFFPFTTLFPATDSLCLMTS